MVSAQDIENRLKEHFPDADIVLRDLTGGGDHWSLDIASSSFQGLGMVQQHQKVYGALNEWMKAEIHALQLNTKAKP